MSFRAGRLAGRCVIRVGGADARHFLHNLLTADIEHLTKGIATWAALLTPQGKILFDVFVLDTGDGFLIDCAAEQRDDLLKRLTFYRLRAKVDLAAVGELAVVVSPEVPGGTCYRDPRVAEIGWRGVAEPGGPAAEGYDTARIALGLADSAADIGSGQMFPHEANMDQLNGVNFSKGCYVGQEVVSRMEHRGTARSRILPVSLAGTAPPKGTDITGGGKPVGSLLSHAGDRALALLRLDRLADAAEPLLTGAVRLRVHKPAWVRYEVAGASTP